MPLSPGSHLGPYEVLALLGAGGMGEVYRARDSRLGREVAIKVLPHDRVADESRRQRFVQEAKAASALNHPHIITIYEIEAADGIDFIVMEYVRGKSLDALIPRQGMRLGEALRIAIAVADAVACAHKQNIVHRDLKPANVMVGTDGAVKVLDFGLAKLLTDDEADPHALTRTADEGITKRGAVMGTLAYMSPEQASGEAVDVRSDVFSFGAMLYEMVTGVGPFASKTPTDTLAAVLRAQPKPPTELVPTLPRELERLILRCLRKEPGRRFQHMGDVKVDLQETKEESDSGTAPPPTVARRRGRAAIAIGVLATLVAGAGVWWLRRSPAAVEPPMRVMPLTTLSGYEASPTFSPDGEQVAFAWAGEKHDNVDIYVTIAGSSDVRRLTTDPAFDGAPSWSPDGRQIAFLHAGPNGVRIHLMSPLGGSNRELSDFPVSGPIAWSPDSRYIAAGRVFQPAQASRKETGGIWLVPAEGGDPRAVTLTSVNLNRESLESDAIQHSPAFSPDGRHLAYASCTPGCDVFVVDLDASLAAEGPSRRLTKEAVFRITGLAWSRDGRSVIYDTEAVPFVHYLWRVGADGGYPPERMEVAGVGARLPATVPSRDRLVFTRDLDDIDIYRFQVGRSPEPVVASSGLPDGGAQYSPDGRRIAFASARSGDAVEIWVANADGSGEQQLTYRHRPFGGNPRWSPDGRRIAFDSQDADGHWHIWIVAADGGAPQRVTTDTADENVPTWSRDGRWVYFAVKSRETQDIWKVSSQGGVKQRVTQGGSALFACESADGKSLLYQATTGDQSPLLALPLAGGAARQLVACVKSTAFAEGPQGIYFLGCDPGPSPRVHLRDRVTGKDELLGTLEQLEPGWPVLGLGVSPDGTSILYAKDVREGGDLMLIENFR